MEVVFGARAAGFTWMTARLTGPRRTSFRLSGRDRMVEEPVIRRDTGGSREEELELVFGNEGKMRWGTGVHHSSSLSQRCTWGGGGELSSHGGGSLKVSGTVLAPNAIVRRGVRTPRLADIVNVPSISNDDEASIKGACADEEGWESWRCEGRAERRARLRPRVERTSPRRRNRSKSREGRSALCAMIHRPPGGSAVTAYIVRLANKGPRVEPHRPPRSNPTTGTSVTTFTEGMLFGVRPYSGRGGGVLEIHLEAVAVGPDATRRTKHKSAHRLFSGLLECQNGQSFNSHKTGQDS